MRKVLEEEERRKKEEKEKEEEQKAAKLQAHLHYVHSSSWFQDKKEEKRRKKKRKKKLPKTSSFARRRHRQWHVPGWFSGFGASHAVFPSIVGRPELPGLMVDVDVKDSFVCHAGFAGGHAPRVLPPSVVRPKMLCIMAGMDQKDFHALVVVSGSGMCKIQGCRTACDHQRRVPAVQEVRVHGASDSVLRQLLTW